MAYEIQRKAELSLVSLLAEILPDFSFYPSKGGDDDGGVTMPRPPFGAIWIDSAEKTMAQQRTWILSGSVVWITRMEITDVGDETDAVKQIYNALIQINDEQCPGADPVHSLMIHGLDVGTVDEFNDAERRANGDTIAIVMGVSEFD